MKILTEKIKVLFSVIALSGLMLSCGADNDHFASGTHEDKLAGNGESQNILNFGNGGTSSSSSSSTSTDTEEEGEDTTFTGAPGACDGTGPLGGSFTALGNLYIWDNGVGLNCGVYDPEECIDGGNFCTTKFTQNVGCQIDVYRFESDNTASFTFVEDFCSDDVTECERWAYYAAETDFDLLFAEIHSLEIHLTDITNENFCKDGIESR